MFQMKLSKDIKESMDKSVLCWLATASSDLQPNVSPKEIFTHYKTGEIIVANIASPQTIKNIKENENVCLSFIDIFVQKGFQIKGKAEIIDKTSSEYFEMEKILSNLADGKFPFSTITKISIKQIKPIIAPSYIFFPETKEEEQIKKAKDNYLK